MVNRIYPPELHLNKANTSDTEAPFLDLHLSISNGFVSSKIYDKCDDWFWYSKFSIFGWWHSTSYGVYNSQLIRFARVSSHVADFNARNKSLLVLFHMHPGISRCRLQHVSVVSSSLFHHSIYLWFVSCDELIHWWVRKPSRGSNNCMFWAMAEVEGEVRIP